MQLIKIIIANLLTYRDLSSIILNINDTYQKKIVEDEKMKSPCKDCTERKMGCHSSCSKYKLFDVLNTARRDHEYKERLGKMATQDILVREKKERLRKRGVHVWGI